MSSWCPGRAGKQIHAEELVRPSVRGFVGTIPDVLAVVERHSTSPKGQSPPGRRGDRRGRRADRRLRHLTQPGSHLLATRTDEPAHGSRSPSGSACKPTGQGRHRTVDSGTSCGSAWCGWRGSARHSCGDMRPTPLGLAATGTAPASRSAIDQTIAHHPPRSPRPPACCGYDSDTAPHQAALIAALHSDVLHPDALNEARTATAGRESARAACIGQ